MKRIAIIVLVAGMAACSSLPQGGTGGDSYAAARREARLADNQCHAEHEDGTITSELGEARCARERVLPIFRAANYPYMDLVSLYLSAKETAARKIDGEQLDRATADAQLARLSRRIKDEEKQRDAGGPHKSRAALLAGLDALSSRSRGAKAPPTDADGQPTAEPAQGEAPAPQPASRGRKPGPGDDGFHGSL